MADLLEERGFSLGTDPGAWVSPDGIPVDLMAPEALAGPGTRGARLGPRGKRAARRAKGLEGALVDQERVELVSLDPTDDRSVSMRVAGPGALLVAKTHKIADRAGTGSRIEDKDALDVFRLLQVTATADLADRISQLLGHEVSSAVTVEALTLMPRLFGNPDAAGIGTAVRAAGPVAAAEEIAASLTVLVSDLLAAIRELEVEISTDGTGFSAD